MGVLGQLMPLYVDVMLPSEWLLRPETDRWPTCITQPELAAAIVAGYLRNEPSSTACQQLTLTQSHGEREPLPSA